MDAPWLERVTIEPGKCGGRPCLRGHRLRVCDVLELLGNGASVDEILADYAFLERADVHAALLHASRLTSHVVLERR